MLNIPDTGQKRIVVIGAGFAGVSFASKIAKLDVQLVFIDKINYHQFQPLLYQVSMAGLEPSSISFPIRRLFQKKKNVFIRIASLRSVDHEKKRIQTSSGEIWYDALVIATGARTNFYGNENLEKRAFTLKSVADSLRLRNAILEDYEKALSEPDYDKRQRFIDIVIVGGGATGVELAGALAEMKKYILPKEYVEIDSKEMDIYLIQSGNRLLASMSEKASARALKELQKLEVNVILNKRVSDFDGTHVHLNSGEKIFCKKLIWAAGICCEQIEGLPGESCERGNRIAVDENLRVKNTKDVFALGDIASMKSEDYEYGHPQVAQPAIQQGKYLAKHLISILDGKNVTPFKYKDKGSMATIGRNQAVVDLKSAKFGGFSAWILWLFVHLYSLLGFRNRILVLFNWIWNYITYDQSLRLIIKQGERTNTEGAKHDSALSERTAQAEGRRKK